MKKEFFDNIQIARLINLLGFDINVEAEEASLENEPPDVSPVSPIDPNDPDKPEDPDSKMKIIKGKKVA